MYEVHYWPKTSLCSVWLCISSSPQTLRLSFHSHFSISHLGIKGSILCFTSCVRAIEKRVLVSTGQFGWASTKSWGLGGCSFGWFTGIMQATVQRRPIPQGKEITANVILLGRTKGGWPPLASPVWAASRAGSWCCLCPSQVTPYISPTTYAILPSSLSG